MKLTNITNRNNALNIYFSEINNKNVMTKEDEVSLFTRIKNGDMTAQAEIFDKTAKFAVAVAKTYTNNPDTLEDLIQECNMGILEAIPRFDLEKGYNFISFAVYYMKKNCNLFLGEVETISHKNPKLENKVNKIRVEFYKENHREASDWEVVEILEKNGVFVKNVTEVQTICMTSINLSVSDGDGSETTKEEVGEFALATAGMNGYENTIQDDFTKNQVNVLMNRLTPMEKACVSMFYGLDGEFPMNFKAIGEKVSKTDERVRQIIKVALQKMGEK